ncbi:MAG: NADP-dependent isocitrate dehydrogenase [Psychroflexus sp.]|nr:NADP-dependent isocitrate dehydrogenase [Psychroflexus sp.]
MTPITIAKGDGIGPEIMDATLKILNYVKAPLKYEEISIGKQQYLAGNTSGIAPESWQTILNNKILLKAPITTPQGSGYKSLNVTLRKTLNLFANVRPCKSFHPYVRTKHPEMDVVIIRENEEDLYAGIEHRQTDEVEQCLKLITRPGCEKISRYAFEYAKSNNRKRVTCFTKDNIMKQTDGLFHKVFNEVAEDYPEIESDNMIVDIGTAKLAERPEDFDVIVAPNLYGDIISDVTAQISGSVGLCGTSNISEKCAMFEAIHGSAPDIAGQGIANPSGLIMASVHMLNHIGYGDIAQKIENALLKTLEDGYHTKDIYQDKLSKKLVNTGEFAEEICKNLGKTPKQLKKADYSQNSEIKFHPYKRKTYDKKSVGVDIFIHWKDTDAEQFGNALAKAETDVLKLIMITNRGVKVWPKGFKQTFCTDHWRCRFVCDEGDDINPHDLVALYSSCISKGFDVIKTENLYYFDDKPGFSLGQGQ